MKKCILAVLSLAAAIILASCSSGPTIIANVCDSKTSPAEGGVQELVDSLEPGDVGCLRGGTYAENVSVRTPFVTLRSYPNERATLRGRLRIVRGADNVVIKQLDLDGTNAQVLPSPTVNANGTVFWNNDVTNNHTGICFAVGHEKYGRAARTVIVDNRIHNCGRLPATNHDHGVYVQASDDALIRGNTIYDNADRGIQLYPDAQRTRIFGNVIDGNGQGIIFGGLGDVASGGTRVEGNVITNSTIRHNVESYYGEGVPRGTDNVVRGNCISGGVRDSEQWGLGGIEKSQEGFTAYDNLLVDPLYADRAAKNFTLPPGGPCTLEEQP